MSLKQNYVVYRDGDIFRAIGQIDRNQVFADGIAARVIQQAVDSLTDGGQVILSNDVFPLSEPVNLRDRVELHGSGRATVLEVQPGDAAVGLISKGTKGTVIADLTVRSREQHEALAGVVIDGCGDCQVRGVLSQGFAGYGIWVRNASFLCTVSQCTATDNEIANIFMDTLACNSGAGDFVPNLISNCTTYGGGTGIACNNTIVLNIVGCVVFQPADYAYHIFNTSNSVLISGCRSFQVGKDAVFVESSHEINISSSVFCWHRGHGIVLKDANWGTVSANEVIDTGVRDSQGVLKNGIMLVSGTKGIQVSANAIFNWGDQVEMQTGIYEDETCLNNALTNNNINYCHDDVIALGTGTMVANNQSCKPTAYLRMDKPPYPDFDRKRLTEFIAR